MPKIEDILAKQKKKLFKKKEYRPWNLDPEGQEATPSSEQKTEGTRLEEAKKEAPSKSNTNQTQSEHKANTKLSTSPSITNQQQNQKEEETANRTQIKHKLNTNYMQIKHKSNTNQTQSEHKANTSDLVIEGITITESSKSDTNRTQIEHATEHKIEHKSNTKRTQDWLKNSITGLSGIQRDILFFLHHNAQQNTLKVTDRLHPIHIADSVGCNKNSVKTSVCRLEEKGFIVRENFWKGRGGCSKYSIPAGIHTQLIEYQNTSLKIKSNTKSNTNQIQNEHKSNTQPDTEPNTTTSSSSSSNLNLKDTTTTTELTESWLEINCEPLQHINFGRSQLIQLCKLGMHPDVVQDSINHFAYDLINNKKQGQIRNGALNYFMGILRREGCYNAPDNYVSPREQALRKYAEHQKRERDRIQKMQEEAKEPHYQQWIKNLTPDQEKEILPAEIINSGLSGMKTSALRGYFTKEIWPKIKIKLNIPDGM